MYKNSKAMQQQSISTASKERANNLLNEFGKIFHFERIWVAVIQMSQ